MTRDEALKKMQAVKSYMTSGNPIWSVTEIGEAFDMAIEALEQPERKTGKWITDKYGNVLCSECNWCAPKIMAGNISNRHLDYAKPNFCWHCGARMVQEGEDNG